MRSACLPKSCARCVTCCSAWPIPGSSRQGTRESRSSRCRSSAGWSSHGAILSGDPLTIVVDVRQNETVDDLDVDFAVHESSNYLVLDARTSRAVSTSAGSTRSACGSISGVPVRPRQVLGDDRALEPDDRTPVPRADPALPVRGVRRTEGPGAGRRPRRGGGRGPVTEPVADPATTQTKGTPPMLILLILFSVALAATAQLALKHGMNLVNDELSPASFSLAAPRCASSPSSPSSGAGCSCSGCRPSSGSWCCRGPPCRSPTRSPRSRTC